MTNRKVLVDESVFIDLAKAIKAKKGNDTAMKPREMVDAVKSLNANLGTFDSDITVNVVQSANQTITATVKDYALKKVDNENGFKLTTDLQFDATVTANSGYKAGTVSISREGNVVNITASEAIKEGGNVNVNWVTYTISDSGEPIKITDGVEEPWTDNKVDADRALIKFGGIIQFLLSSSVITSGIVKIGDDFSGEIWLGSNFNAKILDLNESKVTYIDGGNREVVIDTRKVSNDSLIAILESISGDSANSKITTIISPKTYAQITPPTTVMRAIVVGEGDNASTVIADLKSRGATVMTLAEFKASRADIADYIE